MVGQVISKVWTQLRHTRSLIISDREHSHWPKMHYHSMPNMPYFRQTTMTVLHFPSSEDWGWRKDISGERTACMHNLAWWIISLQGSEKRWLFDGAYMGPTVYRSYWTVVESEIWIRYIYISGRMVQFPRWPLRSLEAKTHTVYRNTESMVDYIIRH